MKKEFLGLRTATYKVGNIKEATQWYEKAFGVAPYFVEPVYVGFNIGGFELGLLPDDDPPSEKPESVTAMWGVEDVDVSFARLIDNGATAYEKPMDVGGGIIVASVKDPWGNIIGIIYNPHFKLEN